MRPLWLAMLIALALLSSITAYSSKPSFELVYQHFEEDLAGYTLVLAREDGFYFVGSREGYLVVSRLSPDLKYERIAFHMLSPGRVYVLAASLELDSLQVLVVVAEEGSVTAHIATVSLATGRVSVDVSTPLSRDFRVLHGALWRGSAVIAGVSEGGLVVARLGPRGVEWSVVLEKNIASPHSACAVFRRDGAVLVSYSAPHGLSVATLSPAGTVSRILAYNTSQPITVLDCTHSDDSLIASGSIRIGETPHPILVYVAFSEPLRAGHTIVGDATGAVSAITGASGKLYALIATPAHTILARYSYTPEAGLKLEAAVNTTEAAGKPIIGLAIATSGNTIAIAGTTTDTGQAYIAVLRVIENIAILPADILTPALITAAAITLTALAIAVAVAVLRKRARTRT